MVTPEEQTRANTLFEAVTPKEVQTSDLNNLQMQRKNPAIMGARVIRKADAPDFYNANGAGKQWMYPMGWADDLAVVAGTTHLADSDLERPFDSHAHPDVEECKYIVSGSGWIKFGYADPKFETETYEFQEGDLIVNPRGVPHYEGGSYEALTWHTRTNCFGNIPGYAAYPHVAYVYTKPTPSHCRGGSRYQRTGYIYHDGFARDHQYLHAQSHTACGKEPHGHDIPAP